MFPPASGSCSDGIPQAAWVTLWVLSLVCYWRWIESPLEHDGSFYCDSPRSPLLLDRTGLGIGRELLGLCPCCTQWAVLSNQQWGGSGCFQVCFIAWLPAHSDSILHNIVFVVVIQACDC